jgi:hypothetical protein
LYTFQALYIFSCIQQQQQIPNIEKISSKIQQQQIPNIQQKIQQQIPNIQQHSAEDPAADSEHSAEDPAADSKHSAEDPAADLAADAPTIKIHFFDLIHHFHNQVKKIMNRILQPHVHNSHPFLKG